jgi:hypothetical protein
MRVRTWLMTQLSDDQLRAFDTEYVTEPLWVPVKRCIDRDFPDGRFTFLDIGGGNGLFADRVLANYPGASGAVLDSSEFLLERNRPHPRKRVVLDRVENLAGGGAEKYDLVFLNWVLHHLVVGASYSRTRQHMCAVLTSIMSILTDRGRVSVYENMYNGLLLDGAPGWMVHHLTASQAMAKWTRRYGANTAGVGVCFQSYRQWCSIVERAGFSVLGYTDGDVWDIPWTWTVLLHIKHIRCGHFWLKGQAGGSARSSRDGREP